MEISLRQRGTGSAKRATAGKEEMGAKGRQRPRGAWHLSGGVGGKPASLREDYLSQVQRDFLSRHMSM